MPRPRPTPYDRSLSVEELKPLLAELRRINHLHSVDQITTAERVALHQLVVPDIGPMEHWTNEAYRRAS